MVAHADLPNPLTVDFPATLHFLTPGGEDVVLPAGTYQVEATESWLKLIPDGEQRMDAMLVDATSGMHDEPLTERAVRLEADLENPDVFHLAMLLEDGTGLEAVGTQSGIRPRGWRSAFVGKLRKSKAFASSGKFTPKRGSPSQLRRPKISLPATGAQKLAPVSPVSKPIKSIHYRGNFPSHRNNGWSDALQGVANDHQHWFFTQVGRLWKFPISHDLNTKVTKANSSKGILSVPIPKNLRDKGYNHFGDLDAFDGYVFIPLEGHRMEPGLFPGANPKKVRITPRIAVFRSSTLSYVGSFLLTEQTHAAWCAIHPITKRLYSSNIEISSKNPLFVYAFDWGQLKTASSENPNSQSRDHRSCTPGPKQVAFFKDSDYRGACSVLGVGSYPHSSNMGVKNDSISSIKVGSQVEVMACQDSNMRGYCEPITKSIRYLSVKGKRNLNDKISSAIVSPILPWRGSPKRKFVFDAQGQNKLTVKGYLQGGDFSAYGQELYIVNGKADKFNNKDGGVWVFSGNGLRLMKRSSQGGTFKFEFHPGWKKYEEPEGITIWNIPSGKAPRVPRSQVHVILLDNDWPDSDEWYFKHYEVSR